MDLGLERAGMICKWQVEIDDYCQKVLNKHWPDVPKFGEVRDVGKANLETVDLIAGGFPCQPHSVAGKRKGAEDDRNLWPEFSRVIAELQPRYVLAENVPGIITTYIDTVLSDLEGQGYTCATFNIPAIAFDAPHRRERIFIVGWNTNARRCGWNSGAKREISDQDTNTHRICEDVADSDRTRKSQSKRNEQAKRGWSIDSSENVAGTAGIHAQGFDQRQGQRKLGREGWWSVEPNVGRVAHGISSRVDRLRGLGNAVVPQVAEWIGRRIIEFDESS